MLLEGAQLQGTCQITLLQRGQALVGLDLTTVTHLLIVEMVVYLMPHLLVLKAHRIDTGTHPTLLNNQQPRKPKSLPNPLELVLICLIIPRNQPLKTDFIHLVGGLEALNLRNPRAYTEVNRLKAPL